MKTKRLWMMAAILICSLAMTSCFSGKRKSTAASTVDYPAEPDYQDSTQWYITDRGAAADVFYIISTETGDYTLPDGEVCHYADTYSDSLRAPLYGEMLGVDTLVSGRLNFFSPYYRQCSLQTFQSDSLTVARMPLAVDDVRRAFKYYLEHENGGRPFILAGFSQGAHIMLELLKEMDDETYERMIAAYAIGITIAETEPHIVPAKGTDDTGVTICYNSVRDTGCTMRGWEKSGVAINPVNWRTDSTSASLITEPSPLLPVAQQKKDTMTVHLDMATGLLIVEGFTAQDYMLPLLGVEGNYHTREIWLYRDQLRENMALRASRKICGRNRQADQSKITAEMAFEGVSNYCHSAYDWSAAEENPDIMGLEMGEETDSAYHVVFRSYTGALVNFYVDKSSGTTRMVEFVPALDRQEEAGTMNMFNYLDKK